MFGRKKSARRATRSGPGLLARFKAIAWRRVLAPLMVLAVLAAGVLLARLILDQPLDKVAVEGRFQRVSPLDVEKAVREVAGSQGLIAVDLEQVSVAVRRIPWVDKASVARLWPDGLSVQVEEQMPVARWGETGLVNLRGELFVNDARHIPAELPELVGPEGTQAVMTQRFLASQGPLQEVGMRLSQLRLDARGAWELTLDNGIGLRLGRARIDERFERFIEVAARVVGPRATEIAYVDLRYANGFAVGWRGVKGGKRG